jgi:hypothetical protein
MTMTAQTLSPSLVAAPISLAVSPDSLIDASRPGANASLQATLTRQLMSDGQLFDTTTDAEGASAVINAIVSPVDRETTKKKLDSENSSVLKGAISKPEKRVLERGALLLSPTQKTVVETPFGTVGVGAKSLVLLIAFAKGLAVYDLHDSHKNAVMVNCGNHSVSLSPGRTAVVAGDGVESFEEINPVQWAGYRKMSTLAMGSGSKLYQSEFDIMSVLRGLSPASMLNSDNQALRRATQSVLKNAALLMQLSNSREQYTYRNAPACMAVKENEATEAKAASKAVDKISAAPPVGIVATNELLPPH